MAIDWSNIQPYTYEELEALAGADDSEDDLTCRIMRVLARAHASQLVYGGDASVIDDSGWTKTTLPAVAQLIANELR